MTIFNAIILGIVQGLTEFFPISSSGHLVILQSLLGIEEPQIAFDVFLHLGTTAAVIIYFRKDITKLFTTERYVLKFLILATVPTFIIGFFFKDAIEAIFAAPKIVGFMLIATGIWLISATVVNIYLLRNNVVRRMGLAASIAVGIAQGIAVIPGISRSGATISTGMLSGIPRELAFKFAFLLSVPAVGGACVLKAHNIGNALTGKAAAAFFAGGVASMIVGLATLGLLSKIVKQNRLYIFGIYCVAVGVVTIFLIK
ncbi:MAG: undecaprenyl-diphosphate phosphatase [Candidatus Omnitrophica bacterium]|nr:undecaprenyl-diphosphate phosphatase [Candidatus Omnitrophota bacterium]